MILLLNSYILSLQANLQLSSTPCSASADALREAIVDTDQDSSCATISGEIKRVQQMALQTFSSIA